MIFRRKHPRDRDPELEKVKKRLTNVERDVRFLNTQYKLMRRQT